MLSLNRVRASLVACTVLGMIAAALSASTVYAKSPMGGGVSGGSKSIGGFTGNVSKMSGGPIASTPKFDFGKVDPKFGKVDTKLKLTDPKLVKIDPKLVLNNPKFKPIDPMKGKKPGNPNWGNKKFPTPYCTPWWCGPHCPWPIFDFDCYCYETCFYNAPVIETVAVTVDPVYTLQFKNDAGATQIVGQFDPIVDAAGLNSAEAKLTGEGLSWWTTADNGSVVESNIGT